MEKVIRDGMVAVLYSPGYGAGWYSWNQDHPEIIFHPKIVEKVEQNKREEITEDFLNSIGIYDVYTGGKLDLEIKWIHVGDKFDIDEYDGYESIKYVNDFTLCA